MQRQLRVFLCHASQDKNSVRKLYTELKSEDWIDPWLDDEKLLPGQDYNIEILKAMREADVIIICLSKKSVSREGYVNREIRHALEVSEEKREGEIFVIPLRFDECDPSFVQLKKLHWLDYFKAGAPEKLIKALRARGNSLEITNSDWKFPKNTGTNNSRWLSIGGVFFLTLLSSIYYIFEANSFGPTELPTATFALPSVSPTQELILTDEPFTPTPTLTPTLGIGSTMIGEDGIVLVYVPAGEFLMGNDDKEADERPEHQVFLDAYWIDQTEITNAMYAKCVLEKKCELPLKLSSKTRGDYYSNNNFSNFPVNYINWQMAKNYCQWAGRDLPTEAQWEKAARGDGGAEFPWGNAKITPALLNYQNSGIGDTTEVGSYPNGVSQYGAFDMAGNVYEWVNDWYDATYYKISPLSNPLGPVSGQYKVARGGAWGFASDYARSSYRNFFDPEKEYNFGFRCVLSP